MGTRLVAEPLPLTLRAYRRLSSAATPLAPLVLARRLKRGKEDPRRIAERRGEAAVERPAGPLIWTHGASVGEMLAVIPLVESLRDYDLRAAIADAAAATERDPTQPTRS